MIHVPAELAGRFTVQDTGFFAYYEVQDEVPLFLRLDCGGEYFEVRFKLTPIGDQWEYSVGTDIPMLATRLPGTRFQRLLNWIRSR